MPEFCPKCGTMVADGTERCPACGARIHSHVMDEQTGFTRADFFHYSLVAILFALGIVAVPVVLGAVCYGLYLLLGPGS